MSGTFIDRCPQPQALSPNQIMGNEDCLKLNIYVPSRGGESHPVMVWIHGGGLRSGSNNFIEYGPLNFLDGKVILVTINYRLGPLGFLSLGTEDVPGNAGMLDQILALQWIQNYIGEFRGDPNQVRIQFTISY